MFVVFCLLIKLIGFVENMAIYIIKKHGVLPFCTSTTCLTIHLTRKTDQECHDKNVPLLNAVKILTV